MSMMWDFLLNNMPHNFFIKTLENKGKKKRAINYKEKPYPMVYSMLKRFLKMKNKVDWQRGSLHPGSQMLSPSICYKPHLAILEKEASSNDH